MTEKKRWRQCPSVYPTRSGFVFCAHSDGVNHEGNHTGFRKRWKTCEKCKGTHKQVINNVIFRCNAEGCVMGNVLVKKEKTDDKGRRPHREGSSPAEPEVS